MAFPHPGTRGLMGEQKGEGMGSLLQAVKELSSGATEAHAKDTFSDWAQNGRPDPS